MRLEYLDSQGIAAEVLFPNTAPPFYPSGALTSPGPRTSEEFELRSAGLRGAQPVAGRLLQSRRRTGGRGSRRSSSTTSTPRSPRSAGRRKPACAACSCPNDHVLKMANLYYPDYDPLWAVCAELGLPVHRHANFPTESVHEGGDASALVGMVEMQFYIVRAIGHMILSGAFERHPDLVFVLTEITDRVGDPRVPRPARRHGRHGPRRGNAAVRAHQGRARGAAKPPSEYFATNCYIAGPTHDLRPAHDLGTPNLMWGADVPHAEGTSPFTLEALRTMMYDLPEDDLTALLATRAAEVYGFDLDELQSIADRIGPTLAEIKTPAAAGRAPALPRGHPLHDFHGPQRPGAGSSSLAARSRAPFAIRR